MTRETGFASFRSRLVLVCSLCLTLLLGACSRPDSMLVREGISPSQADKHVMFRTTYYFRVFDYCQLQKRIKEERLFSVMNDTMYRFTMTGKADSLSNDVHFESGTLKAHEIDPLGSQVVYDEETRRYKYAPSQVDSPKSPAVDSERLAKLRNELTAIKNAGAGLSPEHKTQLEQMVAHAIAKSLGVEAPKPVKTVTSKLEAIRTEIKSTLAQPADNDQAKEARKLQLSQLSKQFEKEVSRLSSVPTIYCPDGAPVRKGFQVLGPEGWRTFDQDERLLMVMSSSGKPLTGVLKELSNRVLNAKNSEQAAQLAVLQAQQKVLLAQQQVTAGPKNACDSNNQQKDCNEIQRLVEEINQTLQN